tara:strand:- start:5581 stop:6084 length:504 start_codon:yes stop_codon:yes gene_type:complete
MSANDNNHSTISAAPEGRNLHEIIDWIKSVQVVGMKFPPKKSNYYVDLGLFLLYYKRYKPGVSIQLVDCEFLGLVEMHPTDMGITVLARFDLPESEEPVVAKGYLLTEVFGDELYNTLPGKGESINLEILIPKESLTELSSTEWKVSTMKGKYKEQLLPLRIKRFLP